TRAKPPLSTPFISPSRTDWDILFQSLFDELLSPPPSVDHPAPKVIALIVEVVDPKPAASTGLPSSTTVNQDATSPSNSHTTLETQSPIIPNDVEEDNHELDVAHMNNDSFFESSDHVDTPMVEKFKLDKDTQGKAMDPTHYHGMIGTLMYLTASRPDLTFTETDLLAGHQKKQKSAAISSTEDEYIALSGCCAQVLWIFHFIKEQVENGVVELYFVNTEYQLMDIITKALGRERIEFLINKLGMRSFTPDYETIGR
ncbi:hypothetical protein Tco_1347421, partial [Tanacetum coccineum]